MTQPVDREKKIDYIEFAVNDIAATKDFYGKSFGWTFEDWGDEYASFMDGRLAGGFFKGQPKPGGPLVVIYSDTLEAMRDILVGLGAVLTKDIFSFPGGRRFQFTDPNGYELAVWSEK